MHIEKERDNTNQDSLQVSDEEIGYTKIII